MATTSDHTETTTPTTTDREGRFTREPEATTASPLDSHASPTATTGERLGKATAAFVTGIIALVGGLIIAPLGILLGIVAAVMGQSGKKEARATGKSNAWMGAAGFWLGIAAIVVSALWMVVVGAAVVSG